MSKFVAEKWEAKLNFIKKDIFVIFVKGVNGG